jgi:pimeloyl-ACP methyl ester carboxylesterase
MPLANLTVGCARMIPTSPTPYVRSAGSGPGVVCLHANASSSSQWRLLMEMLAPRYSVFAVDSYDAGKSPAWAGSTLPRLCDEATFLAPVLEDAGESFTLVGHSYGGAVALVAAVEQARRCRALVLYEPTLFSLIDAESGPPNDADGIRDAVARAESALREGDASRAAECFIDFWMGPGAWADTPPARRGAIEASITHVHAWSAALFGETASLAALARLDMPILCMTGKDSPASSLGVVRRLTRILPRMELVEFKGLGHMGPITHPNVVNPVIADFLDGVHCTGISRPHWISGNDVASAQVHATQLAFENGGFWRPNVARVARHCILGRPMQRVT